MYICITTVQLYTPDYQFSRRTLSFTFCKLSISSSCVTQTFIIAWTIRLFSVN